MIRDTNRPSKPQPFKAKKADFKVKYIGEETLDLTPGQIYQCVSIVTEEFQKGFLGVIDESGESYIYSPKLFERVD